MCVVWEKCVVSIRGYTVYLLGVGRQSNFDGLLEREVIQLVNLQRGIEVGARGFGVLFLLALLFRVFQIFCFVRLEEIFMVVIQFRFLWYMKNVFVYTVQGGRVFVFGGIVFCVLVVFQNVCFFRFSFYSESFVWCFLFFVYFISVLSFFLG